MFLPDVNVWLALAFQSHLHHPSAKTWLERFGSAGCSFCRLTQQGFLRLATNPRAFGDEAVTMIAAWGLYDAICSDPRVGFAPEPVRLEPRWREYTQSGAFSPKVWNDAYLAAFADAADMQLVTFDKGFARYASLRVTILD